MKAVSLLLLAFGWMSIVSAESEQPPVSDQPVKKRHGNFPARAWLGLRVERPDEQVAAQVAGLPKGMGFLVKNVEKDGPAEAAGIEKNDLIWKLGDQMLINEGQLAALLRLRKPGDEVILSGFKKGEPHEWKLILSVAPSPRLPFPEDVILEEGTNLTSIPGRVVNQEEKSATFSSKEGKAVVRNEAGVFKVLITNSEGETVYEGPVGEAEGLDEIPENWRKRVHVLHRTLKHTLDGQGQSYRKPRIRVVPPAPPES